MSAKAIYENKGKELLYKHLKSDGLSAMPSIIVTGETNWQTLESENDWLKSGKLVCKPDQLIKRRGKLGLVCAGSDLAGVQQFVRARVDKPFEIGKTQGLLKRFIIEPFVAHEQNEEFYLCILSERQHDIILFHHEGGVDIGNVEDKALRLEVPIDTKAADCNIASLLTGIKDAQVQSLLLNFIADLHRVYCDLHFTYLEVNPLVVRAGRIHILDLAARLDQCAEYLCKSAWGSNVDFPPPFGREAFPEEAYIAELDARSGASLKLTVLNPEGRVWTMVAGGGASVIYADTVCDMGSASELANYGEYSGAPTEEQTYEYAKTLLSLMTRTVRPDGKVLIIGGGIANFTNVAATFKGIVRALRQYQAQLVKCGAEIFVRRAGPNYQEGLRVMRELGENLGVQIHVFGPETHMTAIVGMALGKRPIPDKPDAAKPATTANFLLPTSENSATAAAAASARAAAAGTAAAGASVATAASSASGATSGVDGLSGASGGAPDAPLFNPGTKCIVWGMQQRSVQNCLDFDFVCSRREPSKYYWGHNEILIPVYKQMSDAMRKHPDASVMVNFASLRSAYDSTLEALQFPQIRVIAIIAEGIPENLSRRLALRAAEKSVTVIGPATVGGVKPGCFKIGNTGGMMDNILNSKLYRPGSVAYVSRSGGMSNELNNIIALNADGVLEGVAIGGDRYPGSTFLDHLLRYQADPGAQMLVVLGEVGGQEEWRIADALRDGRITKPMVAWCIGTCAGLLGSEVQFGHAGACANSGQETASAKNAALAAAGAHVPASFDQLGETIRCVYEDLVGRGVIVPKEEPAPPTVPMDYSWARELGLIRKPSSFMTSICDERGQELLYAGVPITEIINRDFGIGGVLSLLWFQRRLPKYACKFIEIFGGALDGAAKQFQPRSGHRPYPYGIRQRDAQTRKFALENFPASPMLHYALEVEKITTSKKPNLILNVDGNDWRGYGLTCCVHCGCFTREEADEFIEIGALNGIEEADEFIEIGALNGMFVLGRSMGFIGHYLDQRRLKQGLYRHPWDDISYVMPEQSQWAP
uniref:ATP citrate synthase n=1 Tax=Macrostomum lignano TaxID=282301 RepID=A0A1I8IFL2_9PLAT